MPRPEKERNSDAWEEWYRLARDTLAFRPEEAAEYANLRFVEDENRAVLRRATPGERPERG